MGAALGGIEVDPSGRRLTGRHWWGEINDGIPDPLTGDLAASVSRELGLPGFDDGVTGTDVAVILPNLDLDDTGGDVKTLAERLRAYMYWYLWPKMGSERRSRNIDFTVSVDGEQFPFTSLQSLPVLSDFATALDGVYLRSGSDFEMQTHKKTLGRLGHLSIEATMPEMFDVATPLWKTLSGDSAPIAPPYRHIARMRQTELIVDYLAGDPMPTSNVGYVGAFVASENTDEYFAQAEPPTHDAWEIGTLVAPGKGIVQRARLWILEQCKLQVEARAGSRSKAVEGLGRLSSSLGALVQNATGTRASIDDRGHRSSTETGGSGSRSSRRVEPDTDSHVVVDAGVAYVECSVIVAPRETFDFALQAEIAVILAGGRREKPGDAPTRTATPTILFWYAGDDTAMRVEGNYVKPEDLRVGKWTVRATAIDDVAVRLSVSEVEPRV